MTSRSRILVDRVEHPDAARPTLPDDDPPNWDVESTLWLRWRATAAAPVA